MEEDLDEAQAAELGFLGSLVVAGCDKGMLEHMLCGLGEWVQNKSSRLNPIKLSPGHASFIAAILVNENFISSSLRGNAVYLHFP